MFARFNLNQIVLPTMNYTRTDLMFSGYAYGISANLTTNMLFIELNDPFIYSNLSLSARLPFDFTIRPQAQYDFNEMKLDYVRCELERRIIASGYLNLSYMKNIESNINTFHLGFRYELPFAQTSTSVRHDNSTTSFDQYAGGSLMYDHNTNSCFVNNRTSVGKGGIIIAPYLDINCNGKRDNAEPKVFGLNLRINGGKIEHSKSDTTIRIYDLQSYTDYIIDLNDNSFGYISWQITNSVMKVAIIPNSFQLIEVPVAVLGEASGMVYIEKNGKKSGLGRIIIKFYDEDSNLVARTISESDGYFSYLGLRPGSYTAGIDPDQLLKLEMSVSTERFQFNILPVIEGDVADDIIFELK